MKKHTRRSSLPAYMRTALSFLPLRPGGLKGSQSAPPNDHPSTSAPPAKMAVQLPAEAERTLLEAEVNDLRREMERLSAELREKQLRLMHLARAIAGNVLPPEETLSSSSLRGGILPVQHFPPEILQCIFLHVVHADPNGHLPLSQVCWYWRSAAVGCPPLWANISIPIRPSYTAGFVSLTSLAFQRAKASELHLRMTYELGDSVGNSVPGEADFRLLDLALSRQHLWGSLQLDLRDQLWTAAMLDRLAEGLDGVACPRLRRLEFRTGLKNSPRFDTILARLLGASENLLDLTLQTSIDLTLPKPIPSLRTLVIQHGRKPPVSQLVPYLQALPGLTSMTLPALDHDMDSPPLNTQMRSIVLPCLTCLDLELSNDEGDADFINQCDLPNLRHLKLRPALNQQVQTAEHVLRVLREKRWEMHTMDENGVGLFSGTQTL